jgi:preprotein translocase subunit SecB
MNDSPSAVTPANRGGNNLAQDPKAIEVTQPSTHYRVQCYEVHLVSSSLEPLDEDAAGAASRFLFKIEATIQGSVVLTHLHVQVTAVNDDAQPPRRGLWLRFTLAGLFGAEGTIEAQALVEFARMYTLSILWPYAREYTADQLRRAGAPFDSLPIINPQVVTESLVEAGLVEISIIAEEDGAAAG